MNSERGDQGTWRPDHVLEQTTQKLSKVLYISCAWSFSHTNLSSTRATGKFMTEGGGTAI